VVVLLFGLYATQVAVAFYAIEGFRPEAVILAMVSFPVYLKALTNVLRGRDVAWRATGDRTATESPFNFIVPQVLIFTFLLFVTIVGIWKTVYTGTLALSLVWNILNTIIFGAFLALALRETRQGRRSRYAEPIVAATDRPVMVATRKVRA
jgi:cellulose synthase (UDP-forming)